MLFLGSPESMVLQGSLATARAHGIAHRLLDAGALRAQFPQFVVGSGALGLLEEGAGYAIPEHTIRAALVLAQGAGAVVAENTAVVEVRAAGGGVEVHTQHGVERGRRVVVAAGPWTSRLLGGLAPMLRVERHAMVWLEPARQAECHESRMPVWAVDEGAAGFYYGVPLAEGVPGPRGVKVGYHGPGPVVEPNTVERAVGAAEVAAFGEAVHRLVPAVSRRSVGAKVCLYTRSPDDHFIVGAAPDVPGAVVACGFSGHGFKFAPVMGEALAGLALDGGTALPVGFLGLDRLAAHG
jgi:sarcosine oxidase